MNKNNETSGKNEAVFMEWCKKRVESVKFSDYRIENRIQYNFRSGAYEIFMSRLCGGLCEANNTVVRRGRLQVNQLPSVSR
ncbi:MAG: hypothetical protein ISS19_08655 [Bacteroidales bacterium]|nr:hypothetical protein [Bacteroidales bacterium]